MDREVLGTEATGIKKGGCAASAQAALPAPVIPESDMTRARWPGISYRCSTRSAAQIEQAVAAGRALPPTLAIGAHPVGRALEQQLRPVACDLTARMLEDRGHIIPLDRTAELLALLEPFLLQITPSV